MGFSKKAEAGMGITMPKIVDILLLLIGLAVILVVLYVLLKNTFLSSLGAIFSRGWG